MGVPAFYRWLRDKYTKCIVNVVEEEAQEVDGVQVPVNFAAANPNGVEFDNLYLDMNGIIHPCVHPEDIPPPETEEDMFLAIFAYIDRLMRAVRPRKLLFMAIDGVAPRAKMNQQRARRFKAAQEIAEREEVDAEMRARLLARGQKVPAKSSKGATFDHNVITPGTTFMDRLAFFLRYYIHERMNSEPGWRDIRVILSDASVPGEGEHKVMEFIRQQRAAPGYCPNTRHILHGLDADLIMLGLATHEPHFTILREEVLPPRASATAPNACFVCGQAGHKAQECPNKAGIEKEKGKGGGKGDTSHYKPLQFLHLNILREYLHLEFSQCATSPTAPWPMPYDLDRVVDDFVFICFFVGNDFLPHLPSLDIREGAIDLLMALYKALLPGELGGYITHAGHVHTGRAAVLLAKVGKLEDEIFKRRKRVEDRQKQQEMGRKAQEAAAEKAALVSAALDPTRVGSKKEQVAALVADWKAQALPPSAVVGQGRSRPAEEASAQPPAKRAHVDSEGGGVGASNKDAAAALRAGLLEQVKPAAPALQGPALPDALLAPLSASELSQARAAHTGHMHVVLVDDAGVALAQEDGSGQGEKGGESGQVDVAMLPAVEGEDPTLLPPAAAAGAIVYPSPLPIPSPLDEDGEAPPGMEGDPSLPAAAMDAEALAQLVEDEGGGHELASAVKDLLKESVTAALASKHTHEDVVDTVALGVPGWRERYYAQKFGKHAVEDVHFVRTVCCDYASGLVWVYKYYLQGVASWKWFYPHHYAPFAADLAQAMSDMHKGSTVKPLSIPGVGGSAAGAVLSSASVTFELGKPFRPLDQLMGVLPSLSAHALPKACTALMTDPASTVYDFYPTSFAQDPNGKKFSWLWVVLLPFIDEGRLVAAMDSVAHCFTGDERRRNTLGNELLFVHGDTPMGRLLSPLAPSPAEVAALSSWQPAPIAQGDAQAAAPPVDTPEEHALVVNLSDPEEAGSAAASAGGHGVDPARVPSPAISPAVTAALVAGTATGRVVQLRPDQGDVEAKGLAGRILPLSVGVKYGWAAALGGTFASPSPHRLKDLQGNRVLQVCMLPPTRRAHLTSLLPGLVPPTPVLRPEDDAGHIIPKLSRGMNIADLAGEINRKRDEGVGYALTATGYAPAHMIQGGQQRVPPQYGAPQYGQGQGQAAHPLAAMAGGQRALMAGMGITVGGQYTSHAAPMQPPPPAWSQQQQQQQYAPPPPRPFSFRPGGAPLPPSYPPVPPQGMLPYGQGAQGFPPMPMGGQYAVGYPQHPHMPMGGPRPMHMGMAQGYPQQASNGYGGGSGAPQQAAPNWAAAAHLYGAGRPPHWQQQQGPGQGYPPQGGTHASGCTWGW